MDRILNQVDIPEITAGELKEKIKRGDVFCLLDVREPHEYRQRNLGGYLIPLRELPHRLSELDPHKETIVYCKSGGRSAAAVQFLQKAGFLQAKNLHGGIQAWIKQE